MRIFSVMFTVFLVVSACSKPKAMSKLKPLDLSYEEGKDCIAKLFDAGKPGQVLHVQPDGTYKWADPASEVQETMSPNVAGTGTVTNTGPMTSTYTNATHISSNLYLDDFPKGKDYSLSPEDEKHSPVWTDDLGYGYWKCPDDAKYLFEQTGSEKKYGGGFIEKLPMTDHFYFGYGPSGKKPICLY